MKMVRSQHNIAIEGTINLAIFFCQPDFLFVTNIANNNNKKTLKIPEKVLFKKGYLF